MNKFLTACPHCHSLNNIEINKALEKSPICGKCKKEIHLHGLAAEVTGDDLKRIIKKSDKPIIVDFWADWCGPCKMYAPEFEKASKNYSSQAVFLKIDTMKEPAISQQFGIKGIPATIVFKNGQEYKRQSGALQSDSIINLIK